jgi:sugar phosphate isomerase/epimerase
MDRKTFLTLSTGSALGLTAYLAGCRDREPEVPVGQRTLPALGFQLYTVRVAMSRDMAATLTAVAEAGYTEVEFAGYHNETPAEVSVLVRDRGLDPVSAHVDINALRSDFGGVVEAAHTVGHRYLVVPYLAEEERADADDYRRRADEFNQFGERLQAEELSFAYHNHEFEFEAMGDERGMDILLAETDPSLVDFELDFFWARRGGVQLVEYLQAWPGRFRMAHVKDMGSTGAMVDVGDGVILWPSVFATAVDEGVQHFFVEHDTSENPMSTASRSAAYLSEVRF